MNVILTNPLLQPDSDPSSEALRRSILVTAPQFRALSQVDLNRSREIPLPDQQAAAPWAHVFYFLEQLLALELNPDGTISPAQRPLMEQVISAPSAQSLSFLVAPTWRIDLRLNDDAPAARSALLAKWRAVWGAFGASDLRPIGIPPSWYILEAVFSGDGSPALQSISIEQIDLTGVAIAREARRLLDAYKVADKLDARAEDYLKTAALDAASDFDETLVRYARLRNPKQAILQDLAGLKRRASALGFKLVTKLPAFPDEGSAPSDQEGDVIQSERLLCTITIGALRPQMLDARASAFWPSAPTQSVVRRIGKRDATKIERPALPRTWKATSTVQTIVDELRSADKQAFTDVFVFERQGSSYATNSGVTLSEVLRTASLDAGYRKKCAILLPVHENALGRDSDPTRFILVRCPFLGMYAEELPRFFIDDAVRLQLLLDACERGEMVQSITLTPGEKRTATFERSRSSEVDLRASQTSGRETDLSQSDEYAVEFERELKHEEESSNNQSVSASASASFSLGPFGGGSGSAGGAAAWSHSTKDFGRELGKTASKAARRSAEKTKYELTASSAMKTANAEKETLRLDLTNINDGRSLNVFIYRLFEVYRNYALLVNQRFVCVPAIEAIWGSGVRLPRIYDRSDLGGFLNSGQLAGLPVRFEEVDREQFAQQLCLAITDLLKDYETHLEAASAQEWYVRQVRTEQPKTVVRFPGLDAVTNAKSAHEVVVALSKALVAAEYLNVPFRAYDREIIRSPGLYLDAVVGASAATEPYVESMRARELTKRDAEAHETRARAEHHIAASWMFGNSIPGMVVQAEPVDLKTLRLSFSRAPMVGAWKLYVDNAPLATFNIKDKQTTVDVTFSEKQNWLGRDAREIAFVLHSETSTRINFIV
jgi:hypothetical protein